MSSPRRAAAPRKRAAKSTRAVKPVAVAVSTAPNTGVSEAALKLAADVERSLSHGDTSVLTPEAVQALMATACKAYAVQIEAGKDFLPLKSQSVAPTEVMMTASGMLRAVNLAVFELGMWQSWTGR